MTWAVTAVATVAYVGSKYVEAQTAESVRREQLSAVERGKEDLETGYSTYEERMDAAKSDLDTGYGQARQDLERAKGHYDTASKRYDSYTQQGKSALDMYMSAFTEGGEANVINTPMFKAQQDEMNKQIAARLATSGKGAAMKSIETDFAPAQQQLLRGAYSDYFNRLNPIIGYGYGATGQQAQFDIGKSRLDAGQASLSAELARNQASLNQSRGSMRYQHGANLGSLELGKGVVEADYQRSMGNIYSDALDDVSKLYGYKQGG